MKKKNQQIKKRLYISYAAVFIVVVTVIIVAAYSYLANVIVKNEVQKQQALINEMGVSVNGKLGTLMGLSVEYSMSPTVRRFSYMQKLENYVYTYQSAYDIYEYSRQIELTEINNNFNEKILIYYSLNDFGICDIGRVTWESYKSFYKLTSENPQMDSGEILSQNNQRTIISQCTMKINGEVEPGFIFLQTIPVENTQSGAVTVFIFVPYNEITSDYVSPYLHEDETQCYLTDEAGINTLLYAGTEKADTAQTFDPGLIEKTRQYIYNDSLDAYTAYIELPLIRSKLYVITPSSFAGPVLYELRLIFIAAYIIIVIFLILISHKMSDLNYLPLAQIIASISRYDSSNGSNVTKNEYEMIEAVMESLSKEKEQLSHVVLEQNPIIERYILSQILNGSAEQLTPQQFSCLNAANQYTRFNCLYLLKSVNFNEYKANIIETLNSFTDMQCVAVELKNDDFVMVINFDDPGILRQACEAVEQAFQELDYAEGQMGLGGTQLSLASLPLSLQQARTACHYHFVLSNPCIIAYDDICGREQNEVDYAIDASDANSLKKAVQAGDYDRISRLYTSIIRQNVERRKIPLSRVFPLIRELNAMLSKGFSSLSAEISADIDLNSANFIMLERYLAAFHLRLKKICHAVNLISRDFVSPSQFISNYISDHLSDSSLSMSEVAEIAGYSSTYFSKYFKEQFACNYQEYVMKKRISLAMRYLSDSDCSVQQISERCGFANDVTFRRTFKNITGFTPSQFQKQTHIGDDLQNDLV